MKTLSTVTALLLATALLCLADEEGVALTTFSRDGVTFRNPRAILLSIDEVEVRGANASARISWEEADASIQFRLKPQREKMIAAAKVEQAAREAKAAQELSRLASEAKEWPLQRVAGSVFRVLAKGSLVMCFPGEKDAQGVPLASGIVFVQGLTDVADTETVSLLAYRTNERFSHYGNLYRIYIAKPSH